MSQPGCGGEDREIWWRSPGTSSSSSPATPSPSSTPSPYRPLEHTETDFCFYQSVSGSLDNLSYTHQPSTISQSTSSRASVTSPQPTDSSREGSPITPPSTELPNINLTRKSLGSPFLTPSRESQSCQRWWRRWRVGDEEEAVMRGTISYAMSQVRDQHSHQVRTEYRCMWGVALLRTSHLVVDMQGDYKQSALAKPTLFYLCISPSPCSRC